MKKWNQMVEEEYGLEPGMADKIFKGEISAPTVN